MAAQKYYEKEAISHLADIFQREIEKPSISDRTIIDQVVTSVESKRVPPEPIDIEPEGN